MKIGKIPETVLKRSVFKQIHKRSKEVPTKPGVGHDYCGVYTSPGDIITIATEPVSGASSDIGLIAVHMAVNNLVCSGAKPVGILQTILLPEGFRESDLKMMIKAIEEQCHMLDMEIMGGHTEVSDAVVHPVLVITGVGKVKTSALLSSKNILAGQEIVMTKWAGIKGTYLLAKDHEAELISRYNRDFIQGAKELLRYISVYDDAKAAVDFGVAAMHDVARSGIFGALWEFAAAANVGLKVNLKKIPLKQETVEICNYFNINPYQMASEGSLLIAVGQGELLVQHLGDQGIDARVIGRFVAGNDRVIINDDEVRYLEPPGTDEIQKVINNGFSDLAMEGDENERKNFNRHRKK